MAAVKEVKKITTEDASAFLKLIKESFPNNKEMYDSFCKVMADYKDQRIDKEGCIETVKEMFKGHPNLILGFNIFLPDGYQIKLPLEDEQPPKNLFGGYEHATNFVNKIKTRFQDDRDVYISFLNIMNMVGDGKKSVTEAYLEVASLFKGHADLLNELIIFLPDASGIAVI